MALACQPGFDKEICIIPGRPLLALLPALICFLDSYCKATRDAPHPDLVVGDSTHRATIASIEAVNSRYWYLTDIFLSLASDLTRGLKPTVRRNNLIRSSQRPAYTSLGHMQLLQEQSTRNIPPRNTQSGACRSHQAALAHYPHVVQAQSAT